MLDPHYHEVVAVDETTDEPPGTILEQVRRGWMMGDRVLRPAGVRVAAAPREKPDPARSREQRD
jgi:molecular chaperone GrpE